MLKLRILSTHNQVFHPVYIECIKKFFTEFRKCHDYLSVYPVFIRFSISCFQRGLNFMLHSVSSQHFFMRSS